MILLPSDFITTIEEAFGQEGRRWLENLPRLVDAYAARWGLVVGEPFELSYNFVAPAELADGRRAVLKLGVPRDELTCEAEALRVYDGRGSVRLLADDVAAGALLLERLEPGDMLSSLVDDEAATAIAAQVMRRLWRPPPAQHAFPSVDDWMLGLRRLREHYQGGTGPFPAPLVARAERLYSELRASAPDPMLLHGDLHHFNILAARREPWLALDPKGVVGDPAFEVGALLHNPSPDVFTRPDLGRLLARRVEVLSEQLGMERRRLAAWGLVHAVLAEWWMVEDHGRLWHGPLRVAELLAPLAE